MNGRGNGHRVYDLLQDGEIESNLSMVHWGIFTHVYPPKSKKRGDTYTISLWGEVYDTFHRTSLKRKIVDPDSSSHSVAEEVRFAKCAFFVCNPSLSRFFMSFPPPKLLDTLPTLLVPEMFHHSVEYSTTMPFLPTHYTCLGGEVRWTTTKGFGVFAVADIPHHQFIVRFDGSRFPLEILKKCKKDGRRIENSIGMSTGVIIPHYKCKTCAHYVNHSCVPNTEFLEVYITVGRPHMEVWVRSIRAISKGEELTVDYGYDIDSTEDLIECLCGEETCRGYVGSEESLKKMGLLKKTK